MNKDHLVKVFIAFGLSENTISKPFGSGLINSTYLLEDGDKYILQKINTKVFTKPEIIAQNIRSCANYFESKGSKYQFIVPILTTNGNEYHESNGETWRLTPFVENSFTVDELNDPKEAYEAAKAVGKFAAETNGIEIENFGETIPRFHDLSYRYEEFLLSLKNGKTERIEEQKELIGSIKELSYICDTYEKIKSNPEIPIRIQHHDTKINNILFDKSTRKSVCLCDLDTVMPGYFISDLGDMMRTYLAAANEEVTDIDKVEVRPDFYKALIDGYLSEMETILTEAEKQYIFYAGEFLIYMQALRFMTDYLNGDIYYGIKYPENNLNRTKNQLKLLTEYQKLK
ncbi:Phosphotransferase enzyme family protein [Spirosomataceae bacterium TFI 002]|nr:Phosphotransferase enzyme family protein [Spirosomataceae bacterium TFI 002]